MPLVRVHFASFMAGNGPHLPADRLAEYSFQRDLDGWEPVLRELPDRAAVMVLEDEHGLRGVAGAGPARGDDLDAQSTGELYALYVDPDIWGAGYGAALHSAALTHLDGQGFPSAILWVLENNHRARRFYKGNGWQQDEHRGDFWRHHRPAKHRTGRSQVGRSPDANASREAGRGEIGCGQ